MVAGDDDEPDAGGVAARDRLGDLGPGWVDHGDEAEKREVPLGVFAAARAALGRAWMGDPRWLKMERI